MPSFSIQIQGLDQLLKDADRLGGQFPQLMYQTMVKSVTKVKNAARTVRPGSFKNRSGNLRRSISGRVDSAARGVVFVGSSAPYGVYVESGTTPHMIYPTKRRFLAFEINGKVVFARKVKHPGSRPFPFMEPAFRETAPQIIDEYAKLGTVIVNRLAGKA